jgi:phosphate transport system protein
MARRLNSYDRALLRINDKLEQMSKLTEKQLIKAVDSFVKLNNQMADEVLAGDDEIDNLNEVIELESINLISLQQPVDYDLRFFITAMRISRELERISDYACDIAETTFRLQGKVLPFKLPNNLPKLVDLVLKMLAKSLKGHFGKDLSVARQMDGDDNEVDSLFQLLSQELLEWMKKNPEYVEPASMILLIIRYLERIGDHIVNISEMTIFMETGERHPF